MLSRLGNDEAVPVLERAVAVARASEVPDRRSCRDRVRVCGDLVGVSTRARLVPRRALLDQRNVGAIPLLDRRRDHATADRVGREERAAVSRSGEGLRDLVGVSTRARLVPRRALLDQRNVGAIPLLDRRRDHATADRVADEAPHPLIE